MYRLRHLGLATLLASLALGCSSEPVDGDDDATDGGGSGDDSGDEDGEGTAFEFDVPSGERVFIALSNPSVVDTDASSLSWDLAFEGYEIYTNGGLSGPGAGASFGPLSAPTFLSDSAPQVPLVVVDEAGGVFLRWYVYDANHVILSRYHNYGFRDGDRYYKLQIMSYYGDHQGALLPALYTVRYAEARQDGVSETRVALELDATEKTGSSECLNLETGVRPRLTPEAAAQSTDWHVCFRRTAISVNGGSAGPRAVEAVDLDAAATETEQIVDIGELTAASELPRFEAVAYETLVDPELAYRPDGITSGFAGRWLAPNSDPPAPKDSTWYVVGADGKRYLLTFDGFTGATAEAPGRIALRVKAVR